MKSLARSTIWWPRIDHQIEEFAHNCSTCQKHAPNEPETPLFLWNTPQNPWERIHIDYTGPYENKHWFVVIDAHSRWLEIFPVPSPTSANTIRCLRALIARYGVCEAIVSDNGTAFTSEEFRNFCKSNGIRTIYTTPYHSRSNGRVERAIRTFKWRFTKAADQFQDPEHRLQAMLFAYRSTVHSSTGKTPAELFLKRKLRTTFDTLKPQNKENENALKQKIRHDENKKELVFDVGDEVFTKKSNEKTWTKGKIVEKKGPLSYTVSSDDNRTTRVHSDHLRRSERDRRQPARFRDQ
ncbi:uncharacterized protein K02A2.6-like [Planococcus citri]|uniref:uncharacterized protein K02A2.6-like n=1 Tax=Planococcus citri TaxID=170843 RepID=UPI0031F7EF2F